MYIDLSILPDKAIQVHHLLQKLNLNFIQTACLDYEFVDQAISKEKVKDKIKQIIMPQVADLKLHSRATLIMENTASLHQLSQEQFPHDIIAVRPLNQKIFHSICIEYENYDLISFDIGNKLPFMLKRNPIYEAIRKGKYFEINYAPLFDDTKRVVCMTNIANIIKATNGKNLVVSSSAHDFSSHRTPYDVASLLISLGLDKNMALSCMKENCEKVLRSAEHRKFYKGSVEEIETWKVDKLRKRISKHREKIRKMREKGRDEKME